MEEMAALIDSVFFFGPNRYFYYSITLSDEWFVNKLLCASSTKKSSDEETRWSPTNISFYYLIPLLSVITDEWSYGSHFSYVLTSVYVYGRSKVSPFFLITLSYFFLKPNIPTFSTTLLFMLLPSNYITQLVFSNIS